MPVEIRTRWRLRIGNEVGERLPRAGPRLRERDAAVLECPSYGLGHLRLADARLEVGECLLERTVGGKDRGDPLNERAGLGGR